VGGLEAGGDVLPRGSRLGTVTSGLAASRRAAAWFLRACHRAASVGCSRLGLGCAAGLLACAVAWMGFLGSAATRAGLLASSAAFLARRSLAAWALALASAPIPLPV
jgi:hypothetical protein